MSELPSGVPPLRTLLKVVAPYAKGHKRTLGLALFFALLGSVAALVAPQVLRILVDGPIAEGDRAALLPVTLVVLALGLFEAVMVFARRMLTIGSSTKTEYNARMGLFERLVDLSAAFHDAWPSGQLLTRITQDLNLMRRWIAFGIIQLVTSAGMIVVGVILMITVNPILAGIFGLSIAPLVWITLRFERLYRRLSRQAQDKSGDVATVVEESVKGIRILKAFGRAPEALDRLGRQATQLHDLEVQRGLAASKLMRMLVLIPNLTIGICLVFAIWFASLEWVTIGGVVAFFATATILRLPIQGVGFLLAFSLEALSAVSRFKEVIEAPVTVNDPADPVVLERRNGEPYGARLEFDDVSFKFDDQGPDEDPLFKGLSLSVEPGERVALVGLTGTGKSTLISLAARLYDVTDGAIRIDGVDLRHLERNHLREQLSVAFEDPTLFSATVRENVLLGAMDAGDDVVTQALDVASAEFVAELPKQVETVIGEEGMSLSGGQRQRLALARAVAAQPRLMLLDDPLSALDVNTEATVTAALEEALGDSTVLIVAHRPSTVALADRVVLLDRGTVVATGTHEELLEVNERYRYVISSFEEEEAR